jgi:hypothetical protein
MPIAKNRFLDVDFSEISVPIVWAVAGLETMRITASHPNHGAVRNFPDWAALEYTMDLHGNNIIPVKKQYIPSPFESLITSPLEQQTLMADTIALQDCKLFANTLEAYPMNKFFANRVPFFCGCLKFSLICHLHCSGLKIIYAVSYRTQSSNRECICYSSSLIQNIAEFTDIIGNNFC